MDWDAYFSITVVAAVLAGLVLTRIAPDVVLMAALTALVIAGVLTPGEALQGFSNPGVMTIATLYVVAAGLKETGAVQWIAHRLLGQPRSLKRAQLRMLLPTGGLSAFMNNTTVVAMFIPAVQEWANRLRLPPSKLLLPLSYAAILGGTCTLIGTSTNLVVDGLLQSQMDIALGMFELAWVGVPLLFVGGAFLWLFADRLLPNRDSVIEQFDQAREYCVEVLVESGGPLVGKTIQEAGLRHLRHGYLAEIQRGERLLTVVAPETELQARDILVFIGAPECARELRRIHGLKPANGDVHKLDIAHHRRCLVEAVIGPDFAGLGQSIRESRFRSRFQAVILSISREGRRLPGKVGDIKLRVGDTLLLETAQDFVDQYRYRKDFLLVSALNDSTPPDYRKAPLALVILGAMVSLSAFGVLSILKAAFLAAGVMLVTRSITASKARRYINLQVLIVIAASFALGAAMTKTGAAQAIAGLLVGGVASPWVALALVYALTVLFTELITNNAAAVLMFPVATAVADQLGVNAIPFAIAIMMAASASFMTPLGYQTNLMVYGPGGYRMVDYFRIGLPLSLLVGGTAVALIPMIWSF
ncbi:potassium transporter TrkA [Litchfieldella anticariensis FP35 = DSM 16096]|uniref:Potassium transporter TrkA n=1 Tax=Litchfieldella anticariensis (strain DSM 16096 / CECT 5854 / CIP 108499 / LMG 22089 / FP35) TaxID=1121939 RepID=S2KU92_LITA3|nr:SLC13 family permease [Halomonas anticariensis]EPC04143.1 potassium transporter TrkA [Halomonas anticariensis FP35 = DSM 16096]